MANITVSILIKKLKELGYDEKENKKGYFQGPKTSVGKEFIIFLPESFAKKDRTPFLKNNLFLTLKEYKPIFKLTGAKSSAGQLNFTGSQIYIITKLISAKGGQGNKGFQFEKNLKKDLDTLKEEKNGFLYNDFIEYYTEGPLKNDRIITTKELGKENTPRPLAIDGQGLYVSVRGGARKNEIGSKIADIVVETKSGKKHNLSLKYGNTVTFFNSGVGRIFTLEQFKTGIFNNPIAKELIDLFKIDPIKFASVFTGYAPSSGKRAKSVKETVHVKINKAKLKKFIETVIGCDYYLVHKKSNNSIDTYNIDNKFLNEASTPISDTVEILYPIGGSAKRIDIKVETKHFYLNFNIRNKQGGILPSHIMCDYKMKH